MKKWLKIVLSVWFLIFLTDIITAFVFHKPIFCIEISGGEWVGYLGFGYFIEFYYDWSGWHSSPHITPWVYVFINAVIFIIHFIIKRKKLKNEG